MKAEVLISQSAARGLDLESLAKGETAAPAAKDVITRQRCGVKITELRELPSSRAYSKETRAILEREWTTQDLALASAGVPSVPFQAACFAWAGAHGSYVVLHDRLMANALQLRRQHNWSFQVTGKDGGRRYYLEHLCALVLGQECPEAVWGGSGAVHGNLLRLIRTLINTDFDLLCEMECEVNADTWRGVLLSRFEQIRAVYWSWLDMTVRRMQINLRGSDRDCD